MVNLLSKHTATAKPTPLQSLALLTFLSCLSSLFLSGLDSYFQLTVFCVSFLAIMLIGLISLKGEQKLDLFSPAPIFMVLFFLYSYASAKNAIDYGVTIYGDVVSGHTLYIFFVCCLAGLASFLAGTILSRARPVRARMPSVLSCGLNNNWFFAAVVFSAAVVGFVMSSFLKKGFDFRDVPSYLETALISRVLYMEKGSDQGLFEYFTYLAPLFLVLSAATLLIFRKDPVFRLIGLTIFGSHLFTVFLGGSRTALAAAACIFLVYYHYKIRKIKLSVLVSLFAVGLVMINIVSVLRSTSDPAQMIDLGMSIISSEDYNVATLSRSGELLTGQNLLRLIQGIDNGESGFAYGGSLLSELLVFIPRGFLPNRPLTLAEKFVDTFYPGVLESGGGYGFFFLMEGYWSFGVSGVIVLTMFYGYLLDRFYLWCMNFIGSDAVAILYGIALFPLAMYSIRSGLTISIKTALMNLAPILLIMYLSNIFAYLRRSPSYNK